jgi:hypothetical protein
LVDHFLQRFAPLATVSIGHRMNRVISSQSQLTKSTASSGCHRRASASRVITLQKFPRWKWVLVPEDVGLDVAEGRFRLVLDALIKGLISPP